MSYCAYDAVVCPPAPVGCSAGKQDCDIRSCQQQCWLQSLTIKGMHLSSCLLAAVSKELSIEMLCWLMGMCIQVREETGFDIASRLVAEDCIEMHIKEQRTKLFIITNVRAWPWLIHTAAL